LGQKDNNIPLSALSITIIYLVVAGLWIAFTDQIVESLVTDPEYLSTLQTYKGWFYVAITGIGLYWLIEKHDQQLQKKEVRLKNLLAKYNPKKNSKTFYLNESLFLLRFMIPTWKSSKSTGSLKK